MTQDEKLLWLEFLKTFTRALVQINLYKPDHPQVRQALDEGASLLARIHETSGADFSVTLDGGKLIINGLPLLSADKLPNAIKNIYSKFKLHTITFARGASAADVLTLCQMQAHKGDPKEFLKERGIEKISVDEEVYAKVTPGTTLPRTAPGASSPDGTAGAAPAAPSGLQGDAAPAQPLPGEKIAERISGESFESALASIVSKATVDPDEQKDIVNILTSKFKQQLEAEVERAVETVRREKKKVENDIARTESVMSSMAEGVVVVDNDGNILMMNPQAEAISGKPLGELSGKKIFDLPQIENQVVSLAKEIRSENKDDLTREIRKAGPAALAETVKKATAVIQNQEGKIVGAVSIPTDTAKLKEMEQLQQDFIANMTHELRSPLTSIKAALEIMSKEADKPGESSRNILNTAIRNTERLNGIITDILDFSKLQSGKLIFHQEKISPEETARDAAESMRAWASAKSLTLEVAAEPEVPAAYADKRRTVQVLINLISNSIKFTPQGGSIKISVDAGKDALAGFVFFTVQDTGPGISREDQAKIFEKFVQVASGEKVGGTGLGLAITKAMVVMQGGKITVDSEPGKGASFRVSMPVYRGQAEQPVFEQLPEPAAENKPWWKKLLGL